MLDLVSLTWVAQKNPMSRVQNPFDSPFDVCRAVGIADWDLQQTRLLLLKAYAKNGEVRGKELLLRELHPWTPPANCTTGRCGK